MSSVDVDLLFEALDKIYRNIPRPIALHEPLLGDRARETVEECIRSGWVSSASHYTARFEQRLAEYTGANHVVCVVNGTSALHIALHALGVGPGDEVLVPALTFVATANAVSYCGATPHFVDSSAQTLGIDVDRLDQYLKEVAIVAGGVGRNRISGARLAAIVPVHAFGHPVDIDALVEVGHRYCIPVVEDAAEALGSRYKGRHVGCDGVAGVLSFNGNKIVTCGGGGAVLMSDRSLADKVRHLSSTARENHAWEIRHDRVGFNYRLPGLNAALGLGQLEELDEILARKRSLARSYRAAIGGLTGIALHEECEYAQSNYWLNLLQLTEADKALRDRILERADAEEIGMRPVWHLIAELSMYKGCPRMPLDGADELAARLVALPSSPFLGTAK